MDSTEPPALAANGEAHDPAQDQCLIDSRQRRPEPGRITQGDPDTQSVESQDFLQVIAIMEAGAPTIDEVIQGLVEQFPWFKRACCQRHGDLGGRALVAAVGAKLANALPAMRSTHLKALGKWVRKACFNLEIDQAKAAGWPDHFLPILDGPGPSAAALWSALSNGEYADFCESRQGWTAEEQLLEHERTDHLNATIEEAVAKLTPRQREAVGAYLAGIPLRGGAGRVAWKRAKANLKRSLALREEIRLVILGPDGRVP